MSVCVYCASSHHPHRLCDRQVEHEASHWLQASVNVALALATPVIADFFALLLLLMTLAYFFTAASILPWKDCEGSVNTQNFSFGMHFSSAKGCATFCT